MGYWEDRQASMYRAGEQQVNQYYQKLEKAFNQTRRELQKTIESFYWRYAEENGLSYAVAQKRLNAEELGELKDFIDLAMQNIGKYNQKVNNLSIKARMSRYQAMEAQVDAMLRQLYAIDYQAMAEQAMSTVYEDSYYRNWYNTDQYRGFHSAFAQIDPHTVGILLEYPFNGANFSSRLWKQKDHLQTQLMEALTTMLVQGKNPQALAGEFAKKMNVKKFDAYRLLQTESSYLIGEATHAAYKEDEVEKYQILATLDSKTCGICGDLDNEVFTVGKEVVGENMWPFHCFCRCTDVPYYGDMELADMTRLARDPETGAYVDVPGDMKYGEWEKKYVDNRDGKFYNMPKGADLSNWKKKVINTSQNEDAVLANRNYQRGKEYQENCQRCVPAYEMRRRGFDVTAKPVVYAGDPIEDTWAEVFDGAKWKRYASGNGLTHIKAEMQKFGDGARAEVYVEWDGPPGSAPHVFVAEQVNGSTVFIDPQNGDSDVERYFSYVKQGETRMCRIDNLVASDKIFECCEEYK